MPTIEVNGATLYYEDTGPGSTGETIAFSHGLLWGTEMFAPQIEALRGRYRCIAWDHRGQGRSGADHRNTIGIELVWHDAMQLLARLGAGPVHFCGLSMGGFVAMRTAIFRPEQVRSLLLVETAADEEPRANVGKYRMLARVVKLLGPRAVMGRVLPIMLGKAILTDPARRADVERFAALMSRRRDIWRAVHGVIDRAPVHGELNRITRADAGRRRRGRSRDQARARRAAGHGDPGSEARASPPGGPLVDGRGAGGGDRRDRGLSRHVAVDPVVVYGPITAAVRSSAAAHPRGDPA